MVTKTISPKKPTRRKAAAAPDLKNGAMSIDPDLRRRLVAAEAYFLAERRGFAAGNELQDWVAAEMVVDSRLQQRQVA